MDHALKNGAEQVSVSIDDSRRSNIEIRDQKIDNSLNLSGIVSQLSFTLIKNIPPTVQAD